MNKYNNYNAMISVVKKIFTKSEVYDAKRAKYNVTFATGNYSATGNDHSYVVGHFGEMNKGFHHLIHSLAEVIA